MKYVNWIPIFIGAIGGAMLASLFREVDIDLQQKTLPISVVFVGLSILYLIYRYGIRREKYEWIVMDERVQAVIDKSARNGFIATWLALLFVVSFETRDASALLAVVASGLVVFIVSYFIYLYRWG